MEELSSLTLALEEVLSSLETGSVEELSSLTLALEEGVSTELSTTSLEAELSEEPSTLKAELDEELSSLLWMVEVCEDSLTLAPGVLITTQPQSKERVKNAPKREIKIFFIIHLLVPQSWVCGRIIL